MIKSAKNNLNYPLAISIVIHGITIAFFSLLAVDLPKKTAKEPPIHIKKIIFEKKKAAPAKKIKSKNSVKAHKPSQIAQSFREIKRTPRVQAKSLPRNTIS